MNHWIDNAEYSIVGQSEANTINWSECEDFAKSAESDDSKTFKYDDYKKIRETIADLIVNKGYTAAMIRTVIEQNFEK